MGNRNPPRPPLTCSVGVTGHRSKALQSVDPAGLAVTVRQVLDQARDALAKLSESGRSDAPDRPVLRVISPLAEGADRIVAAEALKFADACGSKPDLIRVELACPLPFHRELYREELSEPQTLDSFMSAARVLELDGSRATPESANDAYETVGRTVLDHSDVLLAVWDGRSPRGPGGTGQIAREALERGIPTVWIHVSADGRGTPDHAACLLSWSESGPRCGAALSTLRDRLSEIIHRPAAKLYFSESQPGWTAGALWRAFRDFVARGKPGLPLGRVPDFEQAAKESWTKDWPAGPEFGPTAAHLNATLRPHFAWADGLADYYANLYRSSFLLNYLLGGLAVLFALLPLALGWTDHEHPLHPWEMLFVLAELLIILVILTNTMLGKLRRWHERWIDYRLLAEYLRQIRFLAPLGCMEFFSPPPVAPAGDLRGTWMYRVARGVARQVGLAQARLDAPYLAAHRSLLRAHLQDQQEYHERTLHKLHAVDRRLAAGGTALFALTLLACSAHLFVHSPWLTVVAAVFPAFAAAFAGIRGHAEFELVIKRSEAAAHELKRLLEDLLRAEPPYGRWSISRYEGGVGRQAQVVAVP